jgi:hypothetical protein
MSRSARALLLGLVMMALAIVSCEHETKSPDGDDTRLAFVTEEILTWADSAAYVAAVGPGRIDFVGFFTACSYTLNGRLVETSDTGIVVDTEISLCPRTICVRNVHTRYRGTLTGLPRGERRVILEHVVRDCESGELIGTATVLDSVVAVPS